MSELRPTRLPLGRTARRLSFERRIHLWLAALALPALAFAGLSAWLLSGSAAITSAAVCGLALAWAVAASYFTDLFTRPLNTLSNVVAALREDDYSFRARGGRRGDALGDLALEINALAATLQTQRVSAMDALTLVERVLAAMPSPVLAFDREKTLRLRNAAALSALALDARCLGQPAEALGLATLLDTADQGIFAGAAGAGPWSVRRGSFRLHGVPHTLLVMSDVSAALRREERTAFERLIRVLSHEINNSLTPIQSIAGSLRLRAAAGSAPAADLARGLAVIEDRSQSLHRFVQAYGKLSRMPEPALQLVPLEPLLQQVVALETRVTAILAPGPAVHLLCDPDQVQQALINLVRNAADAALENEGHAPAVHVSSVLAGGNVTVRVADNGLGLLNTANLFVPFYTTKPGGSGIGLALAQQVATVHGGSVTLGNAQDGPGCVAEFTLPLPGQAGGGA